MHLSMVCLRMGGEGIRLIEVHMGREIDILIEHPQGGKFDSAAILESGGPGNER